MDTIDRFSSPSSYIYVCTRLRTRKAALLARDTYLRMLKMSIPGITRFLGEHGYGAEIHAYARRYHGIDLIEVSLSQNLATTYQGVRAITPGRLLTLTTWYLHRWDIVNVMNILRGLHKNLPRSWIESIAVPAAELSREDLQRTIAAKTIPDAIDSLSGWRLHGTLAREYAGEPEKGRFARVENALYRQYYADLLFDCQTGLRGGRALEEFIRLEIDIVNFKNLLRLRNATVPVGGTAGLIPGGYIPVVDFEKIAGTEDRDTFLRWFENTRIFPLLSGALDSLREPPGPGETEARDFIWERWSQRRRPAHEVEMAVTHARLDRLESKSKMDPFSVLPILVYLERKKYEISNIRAIARGLSFGIPEDEIQKYLVI